MANLLFFDCVGCFGLHVKNDVVGHLERCVNLKSLLHDMVFSLMSWNQANGVQTAWREALWKRSSVPRRATKLGAKPWQKACSTWPPATAFSLQHARKHLATAANCRCSWKRPKLPLLWPLRSPTAVAAAAAAVVTSSAAVAADLALAALGSKPVHVRLSLCRESDLHQLASSLSAVAPASGLPAVADAVSVALGSKPPHLLLLLRRATLPHDLGPKPRLQLWHPRSLLRRQCLAVLRGSKPRPSAARTASTREFYALCRCRHWSVSWRRCRSCRSSCGSGRVPTDG